MRGVLPPGGNAWTVHMLSGVADAVATLGTMPVVVTDVLGPCVRQRCLGSLLTMLHVALAGDILSICLFLRTPGGMAWLSAPAAPTDGAPASGPERFVGVWRCTLLASLALEVAACASVWQIYRFVRETGLYPSRSVNVNDTGTLRNRRGAATAEEVSLGEVLCEPEEVALLSVECSRAGDCGIGRVDCGGGHKPPVRPVLIDRSEFIWEDAVPGFKRSSNIVEIDEN